MSKRNERNLDDYETQRNFVCHAENQLSIKIPIATGDFEH